MLFRSTCGVLLCCCVLQRRLQEVLRAVRCGVWGASRVLHVCCGGYGYVVCGMWYGLAAVVLCGGVCDVWCCDV